MSLPEYSLKNRKVVWFFLFILLAGGALGFVTLGKKEDSVFVIKSASLVCSYPGATPLEVEQLVTEPIEREVQSMRLVHKITSESYYGLSKILVELDPATRASEIPQLWDELRRKVLNIQPRLPAGASPVTVADDFGDVYGIYYGLSVDGGFTWAELRDWAQRIKTALVTVDGVQKVSLFGEQTPVVNVYVNLAALANFAIRPETIVATIGQQNTIVNSGEKQAGALQIQILEAGTYKGLDDISNQMLTAASGKQYRLGDIARVERGYADPPQTLMRVDGRRAVGIGISTEAQVDVVKTGEKIIRVLDGLTRQMPVGMDLTVLYPENRIAQQANATFVLNLAESVAIVILIIMLVMGFRAVLIGSSLLFSIGGTLLLMQFLGEGLNRTSLAGFIIAMGMLVDNAIVVTDNAQQAMLRGVARRQAVIDGANAPRWSLLGATLIAIFSFLPLYLAPSSVAEIVKPLFVVLGLSLLLSWGLALTQTPLFGDFMLRVKPAAHDPYDTKFYRKFDQLLAGLLRWRWGVVAGVVALFALSLAVMGLMPQNFFPSLDKPYFRADVLLPEGYNIRDTERNLRLMEEWLHAQPEVKTVSVTMGSTPPRYYLASSSISLRPQFRQYPDRTARPETDRGGRKPFQRLRRGELSRRVAALVAFQALARARRRDRIRVHRRRYRHAPPADAGGRGYHVAYARHGEYPQQLGQPRSDVAAALLADEGPAHRRHPQSDGAGHYHRHAGLPARRVPRGRPVHADPAQGREYRRLQPDQPAGAADLHACGQSLLHRAGDRRFPLRIPRWGGEALQPPAGDEGAVRSGARGQYDGAVRRPARFGDPCRAAARRLFDEGLRRAGEPAGVQFGAGRVHAPDDGPDLHRPAPALPQLPRTGHHPADDPLIFIGVVLGLAVTGKVFNFFSLLGLLGLVGMNIKNAVVLVEQIGVLRAEGKGPYDALVSATRSRIVPVAMASGTTILGMLPLLFDSMFGAMAATIMGGLLVATLLTVCVLPVVYAIFYNIRES